MRAPKRASGFAFFCISPRLCAAGPGRTSWRSSGYASTWGFQVCLTVFKFSKNLDIEVATDLEVCLCFLTSSRRFHKYLRSVKITPRGSLHQTILLMSLQVAGTREIFSKTLVGFQNIARVYRTNAITGEPIQHTHNHQHGSERAFPQRALAWKDLLGTNRLQIKHFAASGPMVFKVRTQQSDVKNYSVINCIHF